MRPADVPLPRRMRALQKDHRGYPVPFVIQRDAKGKPVFVANDARRVFRCITERRCGICGNRIEKSSYWFAGGPLAALHPAGGYLDNAMHRDCMEYAMQVCPYLALRSFSGDGLVAALAQRLADGYGVMEDPTMIKRRPELFVAVCAADFTCSRQSDITFALHPKRPYLAMQFWQHGARLNDGQGMELARLDAEIAIGEAGLV
jgi:hypothetical protein